MATPKKPSKRSTSGSTRKGPPGSASTRKAPTARKTAPKSGSKAEARAAAAAVPEIEVPPKTAATAKAEATPPSLRPGKRRSYGRWAAVAALLAGVVVVIALMAEGGAGDNNATVADTNPVTTPTVPVQTPIATAPPVTTPSTAAPVAKPVVRSAKCDPIIGSGTANSGKTYDVTSSAKHGNPAVCGQAHNVLLSALQGAGTTIGIWSCRTNPSGTVVATCTSTGRRTIQATG